MSFTFKINEQSLRNVEKSVRTAFQKAINNKVMLNEVGETLVTDIVDQTRNKERSIPLKSHLRLLKESWIKRRSKIADVNGTDEAFEDGRSNLTFTGQLLNSFTHKIKGPGELELSFEGDHEPYENLSGGTSGKKITNEQLAKYVAAGGRPFVGIRPTMRLRVNRIVTKYIKRALIVARLLKEIDN